MKEELAIWNRNGIEGRGSVPPYEGFSGTLLVCGTSRELWDDLKAFYEFGTSGHVACLNQAILHYPYLRNDHPWPLRHAIGFDPNNAYQLFEYRKLRGQDVSNVAVHASSQPASCVWELVNVKDIAFSACFAVAIGLAMGYEKIVLAGCSQSSDGHYYDPPWIPPSEYGVRVYMFQWEMNANIFSGRVRSMSGKTKEFFGAPTLEWLKGEE